MTWVVEPLSRRRLLAGGAGALLGSTLLGTLSACGGGGGGAAGGGGGGGGGGKPGEGKTLALSLNGFNTYDQNTAEGCLKALAGTAYTFIGAEAQFDATKEVANIKQLVARQPDGLMVLAASADGAARACAEAKKADIPVVAMIWFPVNPEADRVYYAALQLDTDRGGQLTVDFIGREQGITRGKILEITGLDAQPFTEGYKAGIRRALKQYPGLQVAASQQGFYTADGALKVLKPMLSAHPDAKVIIDYAAEMGVAIAQELQREGVRDVLHVTSDGNERMIPWLSRDGGAYLKGDRWFSPAEQGIAATRILRNKLERGEDPTTENVGLEGWTVVPGSRDPIVVTTRQEMATAQNIERLPPFGYPQYTGQIPFGG
jgi:ribose transport system substrate-binding protein